jgi:hypothetical protein
VTRLADLGLEPGYTLLFDFGCFHGLNSAQRDAYAKGVKSIAAPGAMLLMMAFTRALPPVPIGVSEPELKERLGADWELLWSHPDRSAGTSAMNRAGASWFALSRR